MDDAEGEAIYLELDWWDDSVGAFEPEKVLRQLRREFPDLEIDPTDHQRVRLLRELEFWSTLGAELRETLVRQSWGLYQTMGPTYRFAIPFPFGHRVTGGARRMSVSFKLPVAFPREYREQVLAFLQSLQMGAPKIAAWGEDRKSSSFQNPA